MVHFAKMIGFVDFSVKHEKSVEKTIYQKKNRAHRTSKIVKSSKVMAMAICPIIVHSITWTRALMQDAACEFASVVRMCRND